MTVDGTDYSINQPAPFSKHWYSHKFNGPAVKYEIGVSIQMGHIVWINGPFPGKWHDVTIFQRDLKGKLGAGELVEADAGYAGEPAHIELPHEDYGSATWKKRKANARSRHEVVNRRLKFFGVLHQKFRLKPENHKMYFTAVAVITQLDIENGRPMAQVKY